MTTVYFTTTLPNICNSLWIRDFVIMYKISIVESFINFTDKYYYVIINIGIL
jgi:hypothetical protein